MMELSPATKRRLARVKLITEAWSVGLCMILGGAAAGYGLREYMTRVDIAQIQVEADAQAASADRSHNEEIARLTTAQQQVVTELYARLSDKDEQLRTQNDMVVALADSVKRLTDSLETLATKTSETAVQAGRAASTSQRAATSASKAVKDARGPITEESRNDINDAIEQANQKLKR